jgi:hypothetical protein
MDLTASHEHLDETTSEVVQTITNLAATMKVLEASDPHATEEAYRASVDALEALGEFLDALADEANGDDGFEASTRELLLELEPEPGPETAEPSPSDEDEEAEGGGNPFDDVTPLRRLSAPYSVLLNLERDLYSNRIARPYRVQKLKALWGDLSRTGSPHPSEGLVARLGRLSEYLDGSSSGEAGVPWSDADREAVDALAERAATILDWDDEELHRREREDWVERVRDWVETAEEEPESVGHMSEMLTRFLTDLPQQPAPDVRMLLERILELEALPENLERKAHRAVDQLEQ